MKKDLLPALPVFKANLHAHTTLSDGGITPEDLRALYKAQGYSILAYTDHDVLIDQSALCQPDFLALNGYEIRVEPVHAGLECGAFADKNPALDIISIGPDILDIHSPKETLVLETVYKCDELVRSMLAEIARQ